MTFSHFSEEVFEELLKVTPQSEEQIISPVAFLYILKKKTCDKSYSFAKRKLRRFEETIGKKLYRIKEF